jgi:hypothetical protein
MRRLLPFVALLALATPSSASPASPTETSSPASSSGRARAVRLADLPIPGSPAFRAVACDVADLWFAMDPSVAANAGLFEDAVRVPSYSPRSIAALVARVDRDIALLRAMPWRTFSIDEQIDCRWILAIAETARRQIVDEKLFVHRPAQWLEPLSNVLIAFVSYAPERLDLQRRVLALVPAMLSEVRAVATRPTRRDVETAVQVGEALVTMAKQTASQEGAAAATALAAYTKELAALSPAVEYEVVGAPSYAWRFEHTLLLPWTPEDLVREAESALATVDAELAALKPKLAATATATAAQEAAARALTGQALLGMYDGIQVSLRNATTRGGWVSIPESVGPIHARETPDALVPLTGDGGSMNSPPTYVASNVGYWNVEHFHADWSEKERLAAVTGAESYLRNGMGPYAAHEGFPGHHLQLGIARLHKDPLRSILPDPVEIEGWALYAEEALWNHGGLGDTPASRSALLRSYRHRIARVIYDAHVERGEWTLQRAADFKTHAPAGKGKIDEDLLRAIQWPTQLVCYFAGKLQIVRLKEEMKRRLGPKFDERAFHDALLAEGSVPLALVRAKMLGEPIPEPSPSR